MSDGGRLLFSVAVCTYNRARLLERCLDALLAQTLSPDRFEVIVVDNNSNDDTPDVAKARAGGQIALRCVRETRQGLSFARNRGMEEARATYVAYTDDDAIPPPEWLEHAARVVEERAPILFGGPYRAYFETARPGWLDERMVSYFPRDAPCVVGEDMYLPGANFFARRDALVELGGFDTSFGMRGTSLAYGEESHLLARARRRYGPEAAYYDPALCLLHLVDAKKTKLSSLLRIRFAKGRDFGRIHLRASDSAPRLAARAAWNLAGLGLGTGFGALLRDRRAFPSSETYLADRWLRHAWNLGDIYGRARARLSKPSRG